MNRMLAVLLLAAAAGGCRTVSEAPPPAATPPLRPTTLDYVDNDGFDALFESALVSEAPAIVVRTGRGKPDWEGRLNAWIAAWNTGGKAGGRKARGQAPLPTVVIDGESIREFRLLVNGLMDRVEELARGGAAWYAEERTRSRRVALLRPYNLRFHMDTDGTILLIFFHGRHAHLYEDFLRSMDPDADAGPETWARTYECSLCRHLRQAEGGPGRLTANGRER